jgi:hypothetical protein
MDELSPDVQDGLSRRRLLITATTAVVGALATPLWGNATPRIATAYKDRRTVVSEMFDFATHLGFTKTDLLAEDYRRLLPEAVSKQVGEINEYMRKHHFPDFSQSHVCQVSDRFFYTALHDDRFNACAAFYRGQSGARTMMEGPTLVGLAMVTRLLKNTKGLTSRDLRDLLYPQTLITRSQGTFQTGYQTADKYTSREGIVTVNYDNRKYDEETKTGEGVISVTAIRDRLGDRSVVVDNKTFDITYRTA